MRRAFLLTLSLLALTLSGCLVSESPLITSESATYPLANQVSAESLRRNGDAWEHSENNSAHRSGAAYFLVAENGEEIEFMLRQIAERTFIAQTKDENGHYMYGVLVFDGRMIYEYAPDCSDFKEADLERYGFVKKDGDDCTVTSLTGLANAYLAYLKSGAKPSTAYALK